MVIDIITDDFESFYEIQDDLGRLVDPFCFFPSFVRSLKGASLAARSTRFIFFGDCSSDATEKQKAEPPIVLQTINIDR